MPDDTTAMNRPAPLVVPPAPPVHPKELPPLRLLLGSIANSLAIWPESAFELPFSRTTVFGIETVLVNDPAGVRHMMTTRAANYVRPAMMARIMRPLIGGGLFLAEGDAWRRQRRMLSPVFTPPAVSILLPHFVAAAEDLVRSLKNESRADLSGAFQRTALDAVLRALFSMPEETDRARLGALVTHYVDGPGRPQVFDGFAKSETSFAFALGRRRAFQKKWFAVVDAVVAERRRVERGDRHRDLLDLLLAARDGETGEPLLDSEVRDQCATMIFAGYETTARLMFWASYLLSLDTWEQDRVREEVTAYPVERIGSLDDLDNWPRLRNVLLEALRLYPSVPLLVREALEDDVIAGEPIRRGVQAYVVPWVMHRHRTHWSQPTSFMPDRFDGQASPWTAGGAYLPFGAGPRICIGARFALAEAQIVLATLLRRFRLADGGTRPVLPVGRLTIQPDHAPGFAIEPIAVRT